MQDARDLGEILMPLQRDSTPNQIRQLPELPEWRLDKSAYRLDPSDGPSLLEWASKHAVAVQ